MNNDDDSKHQTVYGSERYFIFLNICASIIRGETTEPFFPSLPTAKDLPDTFCYSAGYYKQIVTQHLPVPPASILEIGASAFLINSLLIDSGFQVTTISMDEKRDSNSGLTTDIPFSTLDHSDGATGSSKASRYQACLVQDTPPNCDYLDIFNNAREFLDDTGRLIILQQFTLSQKNAFATLRSPVLQHVVRQAEDCGFRLDHEVDYSEHALNTYRHLHSSLEKHGNAILVSTGTTQDELNDSSDLLANRIDDLQNQNTAYRLLSFSKSKSPRWSIHLVSESDTAILQTLFFEAFDSKISSQLWSWKYFNRRGMGVLAKQDGKAIAHYGGILRTLQYFGQAITGVQISDVMVTPRERGLLTRKGAFFKVAAAFPEYFVGYHSHALVGFGFPNMRHMRLAELMGLYKEVGHINELLWKTQQRQPHGLIASRAIDPGRDRNLVDKLWSSMAEGLRNAIVGHRNWDYMEHRYLNHPEIDYRVILVFRRFIKKPLGIVVLHQTSMTECHLVDLVSATDNLHSVVSQALRVVESWGCNTLKAWGSELVTDHLSSTHPEIIETDICIPTSVWTEGPSPEELKGKWWLMYGDTDFN